MIRFLFSRNIDGDTQQLRVFVIDLDETDASSGF